MMQIFKTCAAALLILVAAACPAAAQSFLEKLFGIGQQAERPSLPPPMPSYCAPIQLPSTRSPADQASAGSAQSRPTGTIRTFCVRTCDGYYFPLSNSTSAHRLTADNERCKATCGGDSRLYYSNVDAAPDAAAMVDLTGRRYDALNTAFAYRKALRPGCTCRPPPWSSAEQLRHHQYALDAARQEAEKVAAAARSNDKIAADHRPAPAGETGPEAGSHSQIVAQDVIGPVTEQHHLETITVGGHETTASRDAQKSSRTVRRAAESIPAQQRARYSNAAGTSSWNGLFGLGGKQRYVWPGDAR